MELSPAAEALFAEGRRLMSEERYAEACPKFAQSHRLEAAVGTLLNLAVCYEKQELWARAWVTYKEAASAAWSANQARRAQGAEQKAAELEPRLSKIVIVLAPGSPAPLTVRRDGAEVGAAEFGVPIPVDPGQHVVQATSPKKVPWAKTIQVGTTPTRMTVVVPVLADEPAAASEPTSTQSPKEPVRAPELSSASRRKTLAYWTGGLGLASGVVGTYFVLRARSTYDEALDVCGGTQCSSAHGLDLRSQASTYDIVGSISLGAGLAALVTGAVLYWTAPASNSPVRVGFVANGLHTRAVVQGVW